MMPRLQDLFLAVRTQPVLRVLSIAAASLCISLLYFSRNIDADMGVIDDFLYLRNGVLTAPSKVWENLINAPELRSFGNSDRFRIVYNLLNNIQLAIFGFNASPFYVIEIVVFAVFIFSVFYISLAHIETVWALYFATFVISQKYFAHIFTKLGTSETWTMLGLAIYALGFSSAYSRLSSAEPAKHWVACVAMLAGAVLMIGSKENFAILGLLVVSLTMVLYFRGKLTIPVVMTAVLILVLNAYQIAHIALTISKTGVDYYQNDASTALRLAKMVSSAFKGKTLAVSTIACFTALIIISYQIVESKRGLARTDRERFVRMFIIPLLMVITLAGFHFFNLYIYNGKFYLTHRYAFPSVLVAQLLFLLFICWVHRYYCQSHPAGPPTWFRRAAHVTILSFLIYFVGSAVVYSRQMSEINVVTTTRFQAKLAEIVTIAMQHPDYAIVFYSYDPDDFEPLISVATYLRYYSVQNKLMVKTNYAAIPNPQKAIRQYEALENVRTERSGGGDFSPYDGARAEPCLGIDFSGETKGTKCVQLGKVF